MKIINIHPLVLCLQLIFCTSYSQINNKNVVTQQPTQVHVKNWGMIMMKVGDEDWDNAKNEIIAQIGAKEYNAVRHHYDYKSIPAAMSVSNKQYYRHWEVLYEKLSHLKVYKIATFRDSSKGKYWGNSVILKAPYKGNEDWDANVKWDSVYFIGPDSILASDNKAEPKQVVVKNFGRMVMRADDEVWRNAEKDIVAQIGLEEYNAVRHNYDYKSLPVEMSMASSQNRKNPQKFYENLSRLNVYEIARFTQVAKGKTFDNLIILKVPYKGNEEWDKNLKWETVYFIVHDDALKDSK